jgi:hypothetical protein
LANGPKVMGIDPKGNVSIASEDFSQCDTHAADMRG